MAFETKRARLMLTADGRAALTRLSQSRTRSAQAVERARVLRAYADGRAVSGIARDLAINRPKVERCIDKALQFGLDRALEDLPGRGRGAVITGDARAWVLALACRKPKELGYCYELWTMRLLAGHVRRHCRANGYPLGETLKATSRHDIC